MKNRPNKYRRVSYKFWSLTGLIKEQYDNILPVFSDLVSQKLMNYNLKGVLRKSPVYCEREDSSLCGSARKLVLHFNRLNLSYKFYKLDFLI
jgi:hypothetical protein